MNEVTSGGSPTKQEVPVAQSPIKKEEAAGNGSATLTFPKALEEVIKGSKIYRLEWPVKDDAYGLLKDGMLMIHNDKGFFNWMISDGDLLSTDWTVIPGNIILE